MAIMTPVAPGKKVAVSGAAAVRELEARLQETRHSVVRQRLTAGFVWLGSAMALALALVATADYFGELSTIWRGLGLAGAVIAVGIAGVRGWRRRIAPYTLSRAAADAEDHVAQFGQRLRTTLDYEHVLPRPAEASPLLLTALQNDTCRLARKANWENVVDVRGVFVAFAFAAIVALGWSVALVASGDFRIAAGRALLLPLDYTTVTYSPQTKTVRIGEAVEIKAEVAGRPIASAELRFRMAGSQDEWTTVDLSPAEDNDESGHEGISRRLRGELFVTLRDLRDDTEFEVLAGPRALPAGSIKVLQPLTLEKAVAHIVPPAYTGKKDEVVQGFELKVPEGSTIELRLDFNRPASEVRLVRLSSGAARLAPAGEKAVADTGLGGAVSAESPTVIEGNIAHCSLADLRNSASFTIAAKAADGMELEPQRLSIRVQIDRKPEVRFIQPPEELVVTPTTEVPIVVEADDDIGLHKVGVMYQVGAGEMQTLWEQDAEGSDEPFRMSQVLMLEDLDVSYKEAITYYAFAEDNYFGQPRRTTTPLRYIDIRPYDLAYQLVEGGGTCSGCSTTLEELIFWQRQILSQTFAAREQPPIDAATIERLGASQSELLEKTREFEAGLAERVGIIPTLVRAVRNMEEAVEAFDVERLPQAIVPEQEALAELIRTRENMRKLLSQSSSESASACRNFDREQRQNLRMPQQKKQTDKEQQLADVRQKLDDLATRERQWSQACKQCNSGSTGKSGNRSQTSQSQNAEQASATKQGERPDEGEKEAQAPSPSKVAQAQEKMRDELAELSLRLEKLAAAGQAARDQARQADESMQAGLSELKREDGEAAAREGERSAEQLEQLADHLAAMNARDFGQRLDQAQKLARNLANRQETLEKQLDTKQLRTKELARDERALAGETELLSDQLDALERDAASERGGMKRKLAQIREENSAREIAGVMQQAAADLEEKRIDQSARGAAGARERLSELTKSLGALRSEFAQPRLDELVALEEQLAGLVRQIKKSQDRDEVSAANQKWREVADRLESLAVGDKRLGDALRHLERPSDNVPEGHYSWIELRDFAGITQVSRVLQARIQEALLAGALMDSDQAVPPRYKDLVEQYYRALSDDLR